MKNNKIIKICENAFFISLFIIGLGLILLKLFGFGLYAVETGSMGETYPIGSLILVDNTKPEDIKNGDVITFYVDKNMTRVTHRVMSVDKEEKIFITKGDANLTESTENVYFENVIGRVVAGVEKVGYIAIYAKTTWGKIFIVLVLSLIAVMTVPFKILMSAKNKQKN